MKISSAVSVIAAMIAAMGGFVVLTLKGQDPTAFATFAGVALLPQTMALFRQDKTQQDVAIIKQRTNGPLDHQAEILSALSNKVDELGRAIEHLKGGDGNAGVS